MRKNIIYAHHLAFSVLFGCLLSCFGLPVTAAAGAWQNDPPVFEDQPDDLSVSCLADIPMPEALTATDDTDPSFPKEIDPIDSPAPGSIDPCSGGTITRTWIATDADGNRREVSQVITVLPDTEGPVVTLAEIHDEVPCGQDDFETWLSTIEFQLSLASEEVYDACGRVASIDYQPKFNNPAMATCETRLITFLIADECGNTTTWNASYSTRDLERPTLVGVPDNIVLACGAELPPPPEVTATDDCDENPEVGFEEEIVPDASCPELNRTIIRTWTATDQCGNRTEARQVVEIGDRQGPSFAAPAPVTLTCGQDPTDLKLTGEISELTDDCDPAPTISFSDAVTDESCPHTFTITRTWQATDACGNISTRGQLITIVDDVAPTFIVPADVTVNCADVNNPAVTGRPTMVEDNCDPNPIVLVAEETILRDDDDCPNSYVIERIWRVEDACGQGSEQTQRITVVDDAAPVFSQLPQDRIVTCADATDPDQAFSEWLAAYGGAMADDNCSLAEDLLWQATNAGTEETAVLPPLDCSLEGRAVRQARIDFTVEDECGNRRAATATFTVVDDQAPVIRNCREEVTIPTTPGACDAVFSFLIPQVEEDCTVGLTEQLLTASAALSSRATAGTEGDVPVDPLSLSFSTVDLLPLNAEGGATLLIRLLDVDGEEENEFFRILGEEGELLGQTALTDRQCGSSATTLEISSEQIAKWAADGTISLRLEPNIPAGQPGRFAINAICDPPGRVEGELQFNQAAYAGLTFEYSVERGRRFPMNPMEATEVVLPQGVNLLTYYVSDCAGNIDSCAFFVRVVDDEPAVLTCPEDITVPVESGECEAFVTLPLPLGVTDNCNAGGRYQRQSPTKQEEALLTFEYDPNLNDYLAQDKTFIFPATASNATGPATLTFDLLGDFDSNSAFVTFFGEDGNAIGQSSISVATCFRPGEVTFQVSREQINTWAADGEVRITMEVNDISVPPGVPGDGINPCDPGAVVGDGGTDGVSYVFGTLSYNNFQPSYYAEGATTIPLSQMPLPDFNPVHRFTAGETTVYYLLADADGNVDTCTFKVLVEDQEAPVARCQPTTVFINPSGITDEMIDPAAIDAGSTDNCGIDTLFLAPGAFTCDQAGNTATVTLQVVDRAGNSATCSTPIRIENLKPLPSATSGVCGSDTLYLFANPPPANGGIIFTYRWTGPDGFVSDKENPIIPNVGPDNAGSYAVEVTGITGCRATGTVEVAIEDLPLTPELITEQELCVNEAIALTSSVVPTGSQVRYRWFEGVPPEGRLLGVTDMPSYTIEGPHDEGARTFYLLVEADGCTSSTSSPVTIRITDIPSVAVNEEEITVCEGASFSLGTDISGPGLEYSWTGPDGFTSADQFPPVVQTAALADAGVYRLVISINGCASDEALTVVNVLPRPQRPQLTNTGPVCEGEEIALTTNVPRASVYRWVSPDLQEFVTTENRLAIAAATQEVAGAWRVGVSQFGCDSELSVPSQVVVNVIPPTAASASQEVVCENDKVQLLAAPTIADAIYRWTGPNGYSTATQNPLINNITKAGEGAYQVNITTAAGCSGTASVSVVVQKSVGITALSNDAPECLDGPTDIRLVASLFPPDPGNYRYQWAGPAGFAATDSVAVIRNATERNNGNYELVVTTAEGCFSEPAVSTLAVANPPAAPPVPRLGEDTPAPFCEGQTIQLQTDAYAGANVLYNWRTPRGIISTSAPVLDIPAVRGEDSGEYSVSVSINGCNSRESGKRTLSISRLPVIAVSSNTPVCEGATIELRSEVIPGATYLWTGPGFTSDLPNPEIPAATPQQHSGTYSLRVAFNGCASNLAITEVQVKPAPARPVATNDGPHCMDDPGASLTLSVENPGADPGLTYTWFGPSGVLVANSTSPSTELTDLVVFADGQTAFSVQASLDGCSSPLSEPTLAQLNAVPSSNAFAGDDFAACEGFATRFDATPPSRGSGLWSLVSGDADSVSIANPDQANTTVSGLQGGQVYRFRWTLSNGACRNYSIDEVAISVTESEVVEAGEDVLACAADAISLDAAPVSTSAAFWEQSSVQSLLGVEIVDPSDPKTSLNGLEPGNLYSFTWTVVGGCGERTDDMLVLISDPSPFAGIDADFCNDEGFAQLSADEPTEGSRGRWSSLSPGITFSDERDPEAIATGLTPGTHAMVWTIDESICGDISRDTVVITFKENPVANPDAVQVPFGQTVTFDPAANDLLVPGSFFSIVSPPEAGVLEQTDDGRFVYRSNSDFVGTEQATYELCSQACACSISTISFEVGADAGCDIPNIFTPNNDGVNDFFVVPCLLDQDQYPQSQVVVFNRWGDEVYKSPIPYANDWRGTFNGEDVPAGTYFYIVNTGDGSQPQSGYIVIQR